MVVMLPPVMPLVPVKLKVPTPLLPPPLLTLVILTVGTLLLVKVQTYDALNFTFAAGIVMLLVLDTNGVVLPVIELFPSAQLALVV